jgi:cysteine desulfurase
MPAPIYLDHNATTPLLPAALEAMRVCWTEPYLNPASQHEFGRRARRVLEDARERVAALLGAAPKDRVIFTSGGTEANNLAIRGLGTDRDDPGLLPRELRTEIVISSIEHASITEFANEQDKFAAGMSQLAGKPVGSRLGWTVNRVAVDQNGVVSLIDLTRCIGPRTRFVAIMLANNETGVIQPVADFARLCNQHKVPLHVDAAQAAGKLPVDFRQLGATTMAIAAHKFGGPLGIGALVVREGVDLPAQLSGGFQQGGARPGTESVALAVGLCTALEEWHKHRNEWSSRMTQLRDEFEATICREGASSICRPMVIGSAAPRLPTTSNIAFVGIDRQMLFMNLDQAGVACSPGSACASGSSEVSQTLAAMGCDQAVLTSALRFSFGVTTTAADADEATRRILRCCKNLRREK